MKREDSKKKKPAKAEKKFKWFWTDEVKECIENSNE